MQQKEYFKLLTIPGNGVYTVHTAREQKLELFNKLFGSTDLLLVQKKWEQSLRQINEHNQTFILGIASDCGGGIQRGANWGPLYLRNLIDSDQYANLIDLGDIRIIPHLLHDKYLNQTTIEKCQTALYGEINKLPVSALSMTEYFLDHFYQDHPLAKIISFGGDHSVSYPLVKTWARQQKKLNRRYALIHFDAHTDLLDERLGIDLCFGSWTYHVIDEFNHADDIVQIGIRSSGKDRQHWEDKFKLSQFWADQVNQIGASEIANQIIKKLKKNNIESIYISFDVDALDENYLSATGTPEPGGLSPDQVISIIRLLSQHFSITGCDMVELAPHVCANPTLKKFEPQASLTSCQVICQNLIELMNDHVSS
jgi:agmatinase